MYAVIAEPPLLGAVHVTVTVEPTAEEATLVGVPGAVTGVHVALNSVRVKLLAVLPILAVIEF